MKHCTLCNTLFTTFLCLVSSAAVSAEGKEPVEVKGRKVTVSLDAPASNYSIVIQAVYQVGEELWVVSKISGEAGLGATVITTIEDTVRVPDDKKLAVKHKVFGKTWNWGKDTKQLSYLTDRKELDKQIEKQKGKLLWEKDKAVK